MTQDNHKGFALTYNYLNLSQSFTKGANAITMTYTADGEKLTKGLSDGSPTKNCVSGIEYSGANLEAIYFPREDARQMGLLRSTTNTP